jgi:hypothetical protein
MARLDSRRERHDFTRADAALAEVEPRKALPPGHYAFAVLLSDRSFLELERGNIPLAMQLANQALDRLEATTKAGKAGINVLPLLYDVPSSSLKPVALRLLLAI